MGTDHSENTSPVITNDLSPDFSPKVAGPKVGIFKEISAQLGGDSFKKDKTCSTYDLVEQMEYLYVRVVKARGMALFGRDKLFGEVKVGNHRGITLTACLSNPEWDQVFAFSKDCIQSSTVEIFVKERYKIEYLGRVWFDLSKVPHRVPPDSQLEPQWHRMEDKKGDKTGELMLSRWFGTQADEAFSEAWHSNDANVHFDVHSFLKSKVYTSPKLWYLRVSIIEAQDIMPGHRGSDVVRFPEFSANVRLGDQCLRTKNAAPSSTRSFSNPYWNEELFFVVAEPFENDLLVTVEDQVEPGRDMVVVARVPLPVATLVKQADEKPVNSKWFDLVRSDSHFGNAGDKNKPISRFVSRIHLRVSFDEAYNLVDEDSMDNSYVKPSDKRLKKPHIGVLEMGILGATGLTPMKTNHGRGATDAYCVAKYGGKWVRTRTVVDSLSPKWNEQHVWEVYDPCTVVTIGVFHNRNISENTTNNDATCDSRYGKIRIRLSTLETNRVYAHLSYPLLMLRPSGLKKMGELHLAVRFSCTNVINMLRKYTLPVLPQMHYVPPLSVDQLSRLRSEAVNVVASRLSRVESPLSREVVEHMHHDSSRMWSFRRSKAAFFRIASILSSLFAMVNWLQAIRNWQKPVYSILFLIIFLTLVMLPWFITRTIFFYLAFVGIWNYRYRPQHPPGLDISLSHAESVHPDELGEEFDTFPTSCPSDIVRMRYDRIRNVVGRLQTLAGDIATMFERCQALLSWRDSRATFLFLMFCLVAAACFCYVPNQVVVVLLGLYLLRPPRLRSKSPSQALIFFQRLPSNSFSYETVEYEWQEIEGLLITNMVGNFQQCIKLFL